MGSIQHYQSLFRYPAHAIRFGTLAAGNKYVGGCLGPDGKIYFAPYDAGNIGVLDPADNSFTTFGSGLGRYYGICRAPNGMLYCMPNEATQVAKVNPVTKTVTLVGTSYTGSDKWGPFVLAQNGKLYGVPLTRTTFLELDPATDTTTTFGSVTGTNAKHFGACLAEDGFIYASPYTTNGNILKLDPVNKTHSNIITGIPTGTAQYSSIVSIGGGILYALPRYANQALKINTNNNTWAYVGESLSTINKWTSTKYLKDGRLYGLPLGIRSSYSLHLGTDTTDYFEPLANGNPTNGNCFGSVIAPNGRVYGVPFSAVIFSYIEAYLAEPPSAADLNIPADLSTLPTSNYNRYFNNF